MEMEFKPCPFCGDKDLRVTKDFSISKDLGTIIMKECSVCCLNCGATGPTIVYVEDPIDAWNERIVYPM